MAPEIIQTLKPKEVIAHWRNPRRNYDIGFDVVKAETDHLPNTVELLLVEKRDTFTYSETYIDEDIDVVAACAKNPDADGKIHVDIELIHEEAVDPRVLRHFAKKTIQFATEQGSVPESSVVVDVHDPQVAELIQPLGKFVVHEDDRQPIAA